MTARCALAWMVRGLDAERAQQARYHGNVRSVARNIPPSPPSAMHALRTALQRSPTRGSPRIAPLLLKLEGQRHALLEQAP
jgi:hypothetical protein